MAEVNQAYLGGRDIRERSFAFARKMIGLCDRLMAQGGVARPMAPQLLACGLAFGAMLEEARAAESRRDFVSKCSIGLKEIRECHYRLRALYATTGKTDEVSELVAEANQLVAITTTIVRHSRSKT